MCYIIFHGSSELHNEAPAKQKHTCSSMRMRTVTFVTFHCLFLSVTAANSIREMRRVVNDTCDYVAFKAFQLSTYVLVQGKNS